MYEFNDSRNRRLSLFMVIVPLDQGEEILDIKVCLDLRKRMETLKKGS